MFNIDFSKLIGWLLPPLLRQTIYTAWMNVLCAPMVVLYETFMTQRTADLYQVNHDSRVFSIQGVLNDKFDNVSRRIIVTDGFNLDGLYVYLRTELAPLNLYTRGEDHPVYVYNRSDYTDTGADFIVWAPTVITLSAAQLIQMTGWVNLFKLASKRFVIYQDSPPCTLTPCAPCSPCP